MISIRTATSTDLPTIVQLDQEGFSENFSYSLLRQYLDIAGEFALVAEHNGSVIGYVLGCRGAEVNVGWLLSAAVTKEYRMQGVGATLGAELLKRLAAQGLSTLFLSVRPDNAPMIKWCQYSGFTQIADDPNYFGPGERRLVMRRSLG